MSTAENSPGKFARVDHWRDDVTGRFQYFLVELPAEELWPEPHRDGKVLIDVDIVCSMALVVLVGPRHLVDVVVLQQ